MKGKTESCKLVVAEPRTAQGLMALPQRRASVLAAPEARPGDHPFEGSSTNAEGSEAARGTWFPNATLQASPGDGDPGAPKSATVVRNPPLGPSPTWTLKALWFCFPLDPRAPSTVLQALDQASPSPLTYPIAATPRGRVSPPPVICPPSSPPLCAPGNWDSFSKFPSQAYSL